MGGPHSSGPEPLSRTAYERDFQPVPATDRTGELACGSKEFYLPFPVSPPGKAGAGGCPPTPEARRWPAKSAGERRCYRLPPQEGCRPLVHLLLSWPVTKGSGVIDCLLDSAAQRS